MLKFLCSVSMPLSPLYIWEESVTAIKVVINAPGLTRAKSDLLICDTFLRLNFPPYLLQLDLHDQIDDANCSAVFGVGEVTCHLKKVGRQSCPVPVRSLVSKSAGTHCSRCNPFCGANLLHKAPSRSCRTDGAKHSSAWSYGFRRKSKHVWTSGRPQTSS